MLIRGILAVLFRVMAFALPGLTIVALVLLYGAYAARSTPRRRAPLCRLRARKWLLLVGVLGVIVGLYAFSYPGITATALLYLIAVWAIARGCFEILAVIQARKEMSNEWTLIAGGII